MASEFIRPPFDTAALHKQLKTALAKPFRKNQPTVNLPITISCTWWQPRSDNAAKLLVICAEKQLALEAPRKFEQLELACIHPKAPKQTKSTETAETNSKAGALIDAPTTSNAENNQYSTAN